MGCVSSKIMAKSASFREEINRSMRRRTDSIEETTIPKNSGHQFIALLSVANTISTKSLLEESHAQKPHEIKNSPSTKYPNSNSIKTINIMELLAGLEEDNDVEDYKNGNESLGPSRNFRTVEDINSMVVKNQSSEGSKIPTKNENASDQHIKVEMGLTRKAMAKELKALKVSGFEFNKEGSLKDWLFKGRGQVFSPGSYVTPKYGNFAENGGNSGDNTIVFYPELVEQFEHAMEEFTREGESIINEILERLDSENEKLQS